MIKDVAADLRGMLPSSVGVRVGRGWIHLRIDGQEARISATDADALLRRLPAVPSPSSERTIREWMPHPRAQIRAAMWRLKHA